MHVDEWLRAIDPLWICALVGMVIGLESLGIPLPGEVVLVSAALLSAQHVVNPLWVGVCASVGAIIGDSIGYAIGRKGGQPLFDRLGRRFPKHFGPAHLQKARESFDKWGMWAVFFGRFIALLRILAGPLAGALRMPYWRFLVANVLGGILWAGGTTAVIYYLGIVAERWLKGFSWVGLVVAVLFGIGTTLYIKRRATRAAAAHTADASDTGDAEEPAPPDPAAKAVPEAAG
ncbi:DedA family protein [Sphaerisporangium rubeum]|uniref:Membrane protein DedA with SNARE-associated domain n=1 Tax=Sphaerisporangium rubeum TaxID=321317 RepID=A0A7X0IFI3_9ACTN|nr:DedA family protein [Sphaerisporangium rubeum]MBB6473993.1 membrane protein DedA with SNARE-associated domain [Sphaerisporangium rubeum]